MQHADRVGLEDHKALARMRRYLRFSTASAERQVLQSVRVLHDELQSYLVAAKFDLVSFRSNSSELPSSPLQARWLRAIDCLDQAMRINTGVVEKLYPSLVANLGLLPALQYLLSDTAQRTHLHIQQNLPKANPDLPAPIALKAYRIAEHSLAFLLSFGNVTGLAVSMSYDKDQLDMHFCATTDAATAAVPDPAMRMQLEIDHEEILDLGGAVLLRRGAGDEMQIILTMRCTVDATQLVGA